MKQLNIIILLITGFMHAQTLTVSGTVYEITGEEMITTANAYASGYTAGELYMDETHALSLAASLTDVIEGYENPNPRDGGVLLIVRRSSPSIYVALNTHKGLHSVHSNPTPYYRVEFAHVYRLHPQARSIDVFRQGVYVNADRTGLVSFEQRIRNAINELRNGNE